MVTGFCVQEIKRRGGGGGGGGGGFELRSQKVHGYHDSDMKDKVALTWCE